MKLKIENKEVNASTLLAIGTEEDKAFCIVSPELTLDKAMQLLHTLSLHLLNAYTISANGGQLPEKAIRGAVISLIQFVEMIRLLSYSPLF